MKVNGAGDDDFTYECKLDSEYKAEVWDGEDGWWEWSVLHDGEPVLHSYELEPDRVLGYTEEEAKESFERILPRWRTLVGYNAENVEPPSVD